MARISTQKLNEWWNGLGFETLYRYIYIPSYEDANDFIDKCDEYWDGLSYKEKLDLYHTIG